jgi:hypothetical protein
MSIANQRLAASLVTFKSTAIDLDVKTLGDQIMRLIQDVGQLKVVTTGDLEVFGADPATKPGNVKEAVQWGTKFFDAVYYFATDVALRPAVKTGVDLGDKVDEVVLLTKKRLLWTAIFLMIRGGYPESDTKVVGRDVPAFLVNICEMKETPLECATGLASFPLSSIDPRWIREIQWSQFAAPIRQRLGLGLAGYRALAPFKLYDCRDDAPENAKAAFLWVRKVTGMPLDYAILSCTRDPGMIARLGSWNSSLANLSLICFTDAQLDEMESSKVIFKRPVRDPRGDTWKAWVDGGELKLNDPIGLN